MKNLPTLRHVWPTGVTPGKSATPENIRPLSVNILESDKAVDIHNKIPQKPQHQIIILKLSQVMNSFITSSLVNIKKIQLLSNFSVPKREDKDVVT